MDNDKVQEDLYAAAERFVRDTLGVKINDKTKAECRKICDEARGFRDLEEQIVGQLSAERTTFHDAFNEWAARNPTIEPLDAQLSAFLADRKAKYVELHKDDPEPPHVMAIPRTQVSIHGPDASSVMHMEKSDLVNVGKGITVSEHLIKYATSTAAMGHQPTVHHIPPDVVERREKQRAQVRAGNDAEMNQFIEAGKAVAEALAEMVAVQDKRKELAEDMLCQATHRAIDNSALFVDVSKDQSLKAAERMLQLKNTYPRNEINPIDLSHVLEGTKPLVDHHLVRIERVMQTTSPMNEEELPDEIRFSIPNVDVSTIRAEIQPNHCYIPPDEAFKDVTYTFERYVHFNSMPDELKRVVRAYLSMKGQTDAFANKRFKEAVAVLNEVALKLPDEPLSPGVVPEVVDVLGCIDPRGQ